MRVTYFNPLLGMYVVEYGDSYVHPVVLSGLDDFENDEPITMDPVHMALWQLDPDHHVVVRVGDFTYVATRGGVTITFCQVMLFDEHAHTDEVLGLALDAVIAYDSVST